jgi:hypothetical protein
MRMAMADDGAKLRHTEKLPEKMTTETQKYHEALEKLAENFVEKEASYGPAWRVMRLPSMIDLLLIKAYRARNLLTEAKKQNVDEPLSETFLDIASYAAITHIQAALPPWRPDELLGPPKSYIADFLSVLDAAKNLYEAKNADYGAIWIVLPITTLADFVLSRIMRLKSSYSPEQALDLLNLALLAHLKIQISASHSKSP